MSEAPDRYYINSDVLVRPVGSAWIVSNPRLRTHVELTPQALVAVVGGGAPFHMPADAWLQRLQSTKGRDRTRRGIGETGLMADHSGYQSEGTTPWLTGNRLVELLTATRVLVASRDSAMSPIRPLNSLLDRESLGTFHQRVGQHLLVDRRMREPWRAWQNQKFSTDGSSLLDTPYRHLQEPFFDSCFSAEQVKDLHILDFGCGNAYYTSKLAERGARVVGIDSSPELLAIGRANHGRRAGLELILTTSFEDVIERLSGWDDGHFDLVYLQDTLLLLLQPETGVPSPLLPKLFAGFRRLLRPGGRLCAMEPNPVFWLASRYGDPSNPYAVVTEYRHPVFNVAPTLDRLLTFTAAAGFALRDLRHPAPIAPDDPGASGYAFEFPIWDFFVFVPI